MRVISGLLDRPIWFPAQSRRRGNQELNGCVSDSNGQTAAIPHNPIPSQQIDMYLLNTRGPRHPPSNPERTALSPSLRLLQLMEYRRAVKIAATDEHFTLAQLPNGLFAER
jgi:hypothetical protein